MVRLNKTRLEDTQVKELFLQLGKIIAPKQIPHANSVLSELLGKEEQIMIAKRLAIIVLLSEGFSAYKISHTLKLSESTVAAVAQKLFQGEYQKIQNTLKNDKQNYFTILETIDTILHLGGILPHYNGMDRYRFLP